ADIAYTALTTTLFTRCSDDPPLASAAFTDGHIDELTEDGLLHAANLTGSLARGTPRCRCARLRTAPATTATGLPARKLYFLLAAEDSLFKRNGQFIAQVSTTLWTCATVRSCCTREE